MFTVVAFSKQHAVANAEEIYPGVPDQTHRVFGNDIYIGKYNKLIGTYAYGQALATARLISPSLRRVSSLYLSPIVNDLGFYGAYTTRRFDWRGDCPISLDTNEALNAYMTCADAGATYGTVGAWLADAPTPPVKGEIWTVYAYNDTLLPVVQTWQNAELTWEDDLPVGRYQIVGARCWMAYGGLFRFVFIGEAARPGGVCSHDQNLQEDPVQRLGNMGVWGEFDSTLPPSLDVCTQYDVPEAGVYLRIDLIKIG